MVRIEALRLYRREYFHSLRNGLTSEQSADTALTKIKKWILDELEKIPTEDPYAKQEIWGLILEILIEWQILLKDMPIDIGKIPPKPPIEVMEKGRAEDVQRLREKLWKELTGHEITKDS